MLNKLKIFIVAIVMIAVPANMVFASSESDEDRRARVWGEKAETIRNAANSIKKISDDIGPDQKDFEEVAKELTRTINRALKDQKVSNQEINDIEAKVKELQKETMQLKKKCRKVTKKAEDLRNKIEKALD